MALINRYLGGARTGQLTKTGFNEAFSLGQYLQKKYHIQARFHMRTYKLSILWAKMHVDTILEGSVGPKRTCKIVISLK